MTDPANEQETFPVSPTQRDHLSAVEAAPRLRWTSSVRVRIQGQLDATHLEQALTRLVERNEILRTSFRKHPGTGQWTQLIAEPGPITLPTYDLEGRTEGELSAFLDERSSELECLASPTRSPGLRAALTRISANEHVLLIAQPAVVGDTLGLRRLVDELFATHAGAGDDEPMQSADIAQFLCEAAGNEDGKADRAYWKHMEDTRPFSQHLSWETGRTLDGEGEPCNLHTCVIPLESKLAEGLRAFTERHGASPLAVHLAAWQILLAHHADADRVTTGYTSPGRAYEGLETALGLFARRLPVATQLDRSQDFVQLCSELDLQVRKAEDAHEAFAFEHLGMSEPVAWPFGFQFFEATAPTECGGLTYELEACSHQSERVRLQLSVSEGEALQFHYDLARHDACEVRIYAEQYVALLRGAVETTAPRVGELSLLPRSHRAELLGELARVPSGTSFDASDTVLTWFAASVEANAGKSAVVAEGRELDYAELDAWSDRIAATLQERGLESGDFVGLYFERCVEAVAAIVGTLKAGGAYLPLPPNYPHERLRHMAEDAKVACVLTRKADMDDMPRFDAETLTVEDLPHDLEFDECVVDSSSTAYVIYTSGSTGKPKGVPITHANLAHSTHARFEVYEHEVGAYLLLSSFAFDSSVAGLFWTLSRGGTLVLPPNGFEKEIPELANRIHEHRITHLLCLPSLWNAILETSDPSRLTTLTTVIVAGESCMPEWALNHRECLPETSLFNEYGPTEATVWSTVFDATRFHPGGAVPIGRPIPGTEVFVVAEDGELSPFGVAGELYIGGAGVANGYRERPELTREKFVPHRFGGEGSLYRTGDRVRFLPSGELEFLGRIDQQVKVRGYRIELEEIEAALVSHEHVSEAAVVAVQDEGDARLVAHVIAPGGIQERVLRAHLSRQLPDYMVPASFVNTDAFPLLSNGKVDRRALESAEPTTPGGVETPLPIEAPDSAVEQVLALLWQDLLGTPAISRTDDFFQLGGHSILATQLYARILETLGVKISLRSLFEERKLHAIAASLIAQADDPAKVERRAEIALQVLALGDDDAEQAMGA